MNREAMIVHRERAIELLMPIVLSLVEEDDDSEEKVVGRIEALLGMAAASYGGEYDVMPSVENLRGLAGAAYDGMKRWTEQYNQRQ